MKAWCSGILLVLSFVAFSFLAEPDSSDSWISTVHSKSSINFQTSHSIQSPENVLLERDSNFSETQWGDNSAIEILLATSNSKGVSSNNPPLIPAHVSAILFRDNLQTKPIYWLKAEFNPPDLLTFAFDDSHFKNNNSSWFMQSNHKSNSRLSGWKDGNFLYTASITYH